MSHRTKSGQRQHRHRTLQRLKRRAKRKKAALIEQGFIHKGQAPGPRQVTA